MKQPLFTSILILLFTVSCLCQNRSQNANVQARKFDEFVFDYDSYKERIAHFAEALSKEPTAKAYIIAYSSRVFRNGELNAGYSLYYTQNHLKNRDFNISPNRIVGIRGGLREKLDVELFIVPKGSLPPKPTPTFESSKQVKCPRLNHVFAPEFVFENTRSPLTFSTSVSSDTPEIKPIYK